MATQISIAVYEGEIVDLPWLRRAEIRATFPDRSTTLVHAIGEPGSFKVERIDFAKPIDSANLAKIIDVGQIIGPDKIQIQDVLAEAPVDNIVKDWKVWNSQDWVRAALNGLIKQGWIKIELAEEAVYNMYEAIEEATGPGIFRSLAWH